MKAREFWIYPNERDFTNRTEIQDAFSANCYSRWAGTGLSIYVREVLPDEQSEFERLKYEIEKLKKELIHYEADAIHTCGPDCQRVICVERREHQKLKEAAAVLVGALNGLKNDYSFGNGATYDDIDRALKQYREMMASEKD